MAEWRRRLDPLDPVVDGALDRHAGWAERVRQQRDCRARAVHARRGSYARSRDTTLEELLDRQRWIDQHISRSRDQGIDHGIDL